MDPQDILFRIDAGVFSYRVAGILIQGGKVLLQRTLDDEGYAFPGGHANFGETSAGAVVREFAEEIGVNITPVRLLWIGENFFPWGEKPCHQICLYYQVAFRGKAALPLDHSFLARDVIEGSQVQLEFSWHDLSALGDIEVYPVHAKQKLMNLSDHIEQFVFIQEPGR